MNVYIFDDRGPLDDHLAPIVRACDAKGATLQSKEPIKDQCTFDAALDTANRLEGYCLVLLDILFDNATLEISEQDKALVRDRIVNLPGTLLPAVIRLGNDANFLPALVLFCRLLSNSRWSGYIHMISSYADKINMRALLDSLCGDANRMDILVGSSNYDIESGAANLIYQAMVEYESWSGDPIARLLPQSHYKWFSDDCWVIDGLESIPHTFQFANETPNTWIARVASYLLRLMPGVSLDRCNYWLHGLSDDSRCGLHESLKRLVGASSAVHAPMRRGYVFDLGSLVLMAAAATPQAYTWFLSITQWPHAKFVLPPHMQSNARDVFELFVKKGEGLFSAVCPDNNTHRTTSAVESACLEQGRVTFQFNYDIQQFDDALNGRATADAGHINVGTRKLVEVRDAIVSSCSITSNSIRKQLIFSATP